MFKRQKTRTAGSIRVTPVNKQRPSDGYRIFYCKRKGGIGGIRICKDAKFNLVPGKGYFPTLETVNRISHACEKYKLDLTSVINATAKILEQQIQLQ